MTKSELQAEAVNTLLEHKRLLVEFTTGVGKSRVAIEFLKIVNPKRILLVVAETLHKQNWKDEFKKWKADRIFNNVTVECYASLFKYKDTEWDAIIYDEAHHMGTDLKLDIISSIKSEYVLCLSATFPKRNLLPQIEKIYGEFKVKSIDLQQAINNDILPEPTFYIIPLHLPISGATEEFIEEWGDEEKRITVVADYQTRWVYKRGKGRLYPNIRMIVKCTPYQKYLYLCDQYNYWKKISAAKGSEFAKLKQMRYGSERKDFLGSLKTVLVPKLLEEINDKRYVCFCTNIEQCETLGGEYCIHSKKKDSDDVVDRFNTLENNKLFAVFKGIEGMNFNQIEVGVIVQLDGRELRVKQKIGRFMRAENPEIYIFYYKNTRDEEFLKEALKDIDKNYIKKLEYNEIGIKH